MINNFYRYPFTFKKDATHLVTVIRIDLALHIGEDEPVPPPDPDVPPPPPEPEPIPVPDPEPVPPVPDDPIPPPDPEDYPIDEHLYPGFLVLIATDGGEGVSDVLSQRGRYFQTVDEAELDAWNLDPDVWSRHLDHTLAHHATWRCAGYAFRLPREHAAWAKLESFVAVRGGLIIIPPGT